MSGLHFIIGFLHRTGRTNRYSWANHILVVDHHYGPSKQRTYGRTLCGRMGSMTTPIHLLDLAEVREMVGDVSGLCITCRRAAIARAA